MSEKDKTPEAGGSDKLDDGKDKDVPLSSYNKLKAANEDLSAKVDKLAEQHDAQEKSYQKQLRELRDDKPKELDEKVADLQIQLDANAVELARSKAVSRYGLTEDDAARLKGSPEDILDDAEYWAQRKPKDDKTDDEPSNREMIEADVKKAEEALEAANARKTTDSAVAGDNKRVEGAAPAKPEPSKTGELSWLQKYEAANPRERYDMDRQVQAGIVDPTK